MPRYDDEISRRMEAHLQQGRAERNKDEQERWREDDHETQRMQMQVKKRVEDERKRITDELKRADEEARILENQAQRLAHELKRGVETRRGTSDISQQEREKEERRRFEEEVERRAEEKARAMIFNRRTEDAVAAERARRIEDEADRKARERLAEMRLRSEEDDRTRRLSDSVASRNMATNYQQERQRYSTNDDTAARKLLADESAKIAARAKLGSSNDTGDIPNFTFTRDRTFSTESNMTRQSQQLEMRLAAPYQTSSVSSSMASPFKGPPGVGARPSPMANLVMNSSSASRVPVSMAPTNDGSTSKGSLGSIFEVSAPPGPLGLTLVPHTIQVTNTLS